VKPQRAKLPRKARLQGGAQFTGEFPVRRFGRYFVVLARRNTAGGSGRLGLVAARKAVPLAVARNMMKRAAREVFRKVRQNCFDGHRDQVRRPAWHTSFRGSKLLKLLVGVS
jgi:ribonuclease P protein component